MKSYTRPLNFGTILKRKQHPECHRIETSIANNILLILTTRLGEDRYDPKYGCDVWD